MAPVGSGSTAIVRAVSVAAIVAIVAPAQVTADECDDTLQFAMLVAEVIDEAQTVIPSFVDGILEERSASRHRRFLSRMFALAERMQGVRATMPNTPAAQVVDRPLGEMQNGILLMAMWADFYRNDPGNAATDRYAQLMRRIAESGRMVGATFPKNDVWADLLAISGCATEAKATAEPATAEVPAPAPSPPPPPEPIEPTDVPALSGDFPIGRWSLWTYFDADDFVKSTRGDFSRHYKDEFELAGGSIGRALVFHPDDEDLFEQSFRFPGVTGKWTYDDEHEFRWWLEEYGHQYGQIYGTLRFQSNKNRDYVVTRVTGDSALLTYRLPDGRLYIGGHSMLVRIGSPLYYSLWTFDECVEGNKGKKLFEVTECIVPGFRYLPPTFDYENLPPALPP